MMMQLLLLPYLCVTIRKVQKVQSLVTFEIENEVF